MDWQGRRMIAPGGMRAPPNMMQQMQPGAHPVAGGGGGMIVNDLSQRVHDLDQRLTLTEHANRAALDEVYGLRDSIRNEINGSSDMQKQIRSNGDSIAGVNVRLRRCEDTVEEMHRKQDDLVSLTNRLEGQFLRNEGDKRLGSESASREAREARQRCDELSRIVDHQTRVTDALSHELASIRGRVDIKDFRAEKRKETSNYDDVYQTVQIQSNASNVSAQVRQETAMIRSTYDSKIDVAMKMINELQASVTGNEEKIEKLTVENEKLTAELKMMKPAKQINIGQPDEDSSKSAGVVAKFEQLVKEVDQCFAELGRQMQRESKARHDFEQKMREEVKSTDIQFETKAKLEKLENAVKETQRVVHAPSFKLLKSSSSNASGGDNENLSELYALVEKLQDKVDNELDNPRLAVEVEVMQQKTNDLMGRLNDIEMSKHDKPILSKLVSGDNGEENTATVEMTMQMNEVMESLRKNKLEIGMANQACEGNWTSIRIFPKFLMQHKSRSYENV